MKHALSGGSANHRICWSFVSRSRHARESVDEIPPLRSYWCRCGCTPPCEGLARRVSWRGVGRVVHANSRGTGGQEAGEDLSHQPGRITCTGMCRGVELSPGGASAKAAGRCDPARGGPEEAAGRPGKIGGSVGETKGSSDPRGAGTPAARRAGDQSAARSEEKAGKAGKEEVGKGEAKAEGAAGQHHRCRGDSDENGQRRVQSGGERAVRNGYGK